MGDMDTTPPAKPDKETDTPRLGPRFADAFVFAEELHRRQLRKGSDIPYLSHLMAVASLVMEHGGDEDVAVAALLHDAVEDQGGEAVAEQIRARFGERVVRIVLGCSDSTEVKGAPKRPWIERKRRYLGHFESVGDDVRLVSIADKLHNCRCTVLNLREDGASTWDRFNATRDEALWFYRTFVERAKTLYPHPIVRELERAVAELEALA